MTIETKRSLIRRIAETTGFRQDEIRPLEGTLSGGRYVAVAFAVKGKGFCTDFTDWDRDRNYDMDR